MTVAIKVPLLDLKAQHETMREDIAEAIAEVNESQWKSMKIMFEGEFPFEIELRNC